MLIFPTDLYWLRFSAAITLSFLQSKFHVINLKLDTETSLVELKVYFHDLYKKQLDYTEKLTE